MCVCVCVGQKKLRQLIGDWAGIPRSHTQWGEIITADTCRRDISSLNVTVEKPASSNESSRILIVRCVVAIQFLAVARQCKVTGSILCSELREPKMA